MSELPQPSFSRGEISPSLYGRVDLSLYSTALRKLTNMFVRPFGGASSRSGTRYLARTKYQDRKSVLVKFIYSTEQVYLIEFGHLYALIYANNAKVRTGTVFTVTSVGETGGHFVVTTSGAHGLSVDDVVAIRDVVATGGYKAINDDWTVAAVPTPTTFRVARNSSAGGTYVSGGTVQECLQVVTPYTEDDVDGIRVTQSADVMTVMHRDYPQYDLARTSATSFTFTEAEFEDGPFLDINPDEARTVYASAVSGSVTLTADSNIFNANHVGALFYMEEKDLRRVPPWEPSKLINVPGNSETYGLLRRSDGKTYSCLTRAYSQSIATGSVKPTHEEGVAPDGDGKRVSGLADRTGVTWQYLHSGYGILRITAYTSPTQVTATVLSRLPDSVVGGTVIAAGPWTMTGDGADVTLSVTGATSSRADDYEVLVDGEQLSPTDYTVNPTTDVLTFLVAPALAAAVTVTQIDSNNLTDIWAFGAWSEDQGYPRTGTYYGDRKVFSGTRAAPQRVDMSKVGEYDDYGFSIPGIDSDSIAMTMNARQINAINDLVPLDQLVALTSSGAWRIGAGDNDAITPTTVGFRPQVYRGAGELPAVIIGDTALYVTYNGTKIRDLQYQVNADKFTGDDVTLTASHLLTPTRTVVDMSFADEPHGIVWIVRSDGVLLSLTYLREQEVVGWAKHDTDGIVERVCAIPIGGVDVPYFIVKRTINGVVQRYVETLTNRDVDDTRDVVCVDASLTYDGRGDGTDTVTLTGGAWASGQNVTVTLTDSLLESGDVGNEIWVYADEYIYRGRITTVYGPTSALLLSLIDVPASIQAVASTDYGLAKDLFYGLDHLVGKTVAVCADSTVHASIEVEDDGSVQLGQHGVVVHIGLPFTAEMETLDINIVGKSSAYMQSKLVKRVALYVQDSRGFFAGSDRSALNEYLSRGQEDDYEAPAATTGVAEVQLTSSYNDHGRVVIQQTNPLPLTVLAVVPDVTGGP